MGICEQVARQRGTRRIQARGAFAYLPQVCKRQVRGTARKAHRRRPPEIRGNARVLQQGQRLLPGRNFPLELYHRACPPKRYCAPDRYRACEHRKEEQGVARGAPRQLFLASAARHRKTRGAHQRHRRHRHHQGQGTGCRWPRL